MGENPKTQRRRAMRGCMACSLAGRLAEGSGTSPLCPGGREGSQGIPPCPPCHGWFTSELAEVWPCLRETVPPPPPLPLRSPRSQCNFARNVAENGFVCFAAPGELIGRLRRAGVAALLLSRKVAAGSARFCPASFLSGDLSSFLGAKHFAVMLAA